MTSAIPTHDLGDIPPQANIKVSSTETGIVFGSIVYESAGGASDRNYVVLNDIHIDIMDYIEPATCSDLAFRAMWAEFEWENKVTRTPTQIRMSHARTSRAVHPHQR